MGLPSNTRSHLPARGPSFHAPSPRPGPLTKTGQNETAPPDPSCHAQTPEILETPNLTRPSKAFMRYRGLETLPGALHVSVGDVYQQTQPVSVLVARIRKAVHDRLAALGSIEAASAVSTVYVELPCTFFALRTASILPLATEVSLSLPFNATLDRLALRTVAAMRAAKVPSFNGVHLRMEKDAGDWMVILGGRGAVWSMYLNAMRRVGFNASTPLYVATGLLSYGAEQEWEDAKRVLINARVASSVIIKNQYIPDFELEGASAQCWLLRVCPARGRRKGEGSLRVLRAVVGQGPPNSVCAQGSGEIPGQGLCQPTNPCSPTDQPPPPPPRAGLNTEQQALLDFLILARGNLFVGLGSSTFSYYIAQYRHLFGHSIDSSLLVAASRVGTDGMFASSAVVTHKPNAI